MLGSFVSVPLLALLASSVVRRLQTRLLAGLLTYARSSLGSMVYKYAYREPFSGCSCFMIRESKAPPLHDLPKCA
jgi:hypothetical protein